MREVASPSGKATAVIRYESGLSPDTAYVVSLKGSSGSKELTSASAVLHIEWRENPETLSIFSTPAYWTTNEAVYKEVFDVTGRRLTKEIVGEFRTWKGPQHPVAPYSEPAARSPQG